MLKSNDKLILFPVVVLMLLALTSGCNSIPLFKPEARPLNRIASANEIITEINNTVADYVGRGWLTQDYVDKSISPQLDRATLAVDEAEVLVRAGRMNEGTTKIEQANVVLKTLRQLLVEVRNSRS